MTATALLVLCLAAPPAEAPLDEQTVAALVADLGGTDSAKQRAAYEALKKAGPRAKAAVPALVKLLDPKGNHRYAAAEILGAIGPDAKEAVPALLALVSEEPGSFGYGAETVAWALARIDSPKIEATRALLLASGKGIPITLTHSNTLRENPAEVVLHLITLCGDKDPKVRQNAATVLGGLKEKPVQKVPHKSLFEQAGCATRGIPGALEILLTDENEAVRLMAAWAVTHVAPQLTEKALAVVVAVAVETEGKPKSGISASDTFAPVPKEALKVLVPLLDHANDNVRWWGINHLAYLPVREPIEDLLKNGKTARARAGAASALGARYSGGAESVPALVAALSDGEFGVRYAAARALVWVRPRESAANADAVAVLVEGLRQKEERVRLDASQTLLTSGPAAKAALPALKELLADEKPAVRLEAALALVGIDAKEATGTVPALVEGLKWDEYHATRAARALTVLGPVAKDAVPELVKHLDAKNLRLRVAAAEAAGFIDPAQGPKAAEVLVGLLQDKKSRWSAVRREAIVALQRIGPPAKAALPALEELLKDDGPFHADAAVAMIAIDPVGTNPAFEWVRKALTKKGDDDAYDLVESLPGLGAKAKPLVPDVTALLKAKEPQFRENAVVFLAGMGPHAKEALPELKKLAETDPRPDLRKLAAEAIKKIEAK